MTFSTELIQLNDGTQIAAPADKALMTNFILKEQGDWFEHEIHFVRDFVKGDMHALDIGANYGLYAMAIARKLDTGHLWCFEPTTNTANALRKTIAANNLEEKVSLVEAGLSDHEGQATFYTSENSELNSLTAGENTNGEKLTIDLHTLDACYEQYAWPKLDFIKLDAEGEELNILKASKKTLTECSPLIMFELKHGNKVNTPLVEAFSNLGYKSYHLIPKLNILVPFDASVRIDGFMLNLFCCKENTAKKLEKAGFMVTNAQAKKTDDTEHFNNILGKKTYFKDLSLTNKQAPNNELKEVLSAYGSYRNESLTKQARYEHLLYAFGIVQQALQKGESNILSLSSYARVAFDIGQRSIGVQICDHLMKTYMKSGTPFQVDRPFISAGNSFENVALNKGNPQAWICCSILDAFIKESAFSSYFSGARILPVIDELAKHGFLQDDISKRKELILAILDEKK